MPDEAPSVEDHTNPVSLYKRVKRQRERILAFVTEDWERWEIDTEDGAAEMIAINELGRERVIEFSPDWRIRRAR